MDPLLFSPMSLIFKGFLALIFAALGYLLFQVVLLPMWELRFYKKQGLTTYFYPLLGFNKKQKVVEAKENDYMGYFRQLAEENQNVAAEAANFGKRVTVLLYDPKLMKEFYAKQSNYVKAKSSPIMSAMMGTGLFLAEGNLWKVHRRVISNKFHFEFLKDNIPLIVSTTREFFNELAKTSMTRVSILDEAQKITGEVVGRIFFGQNLNQYKMQGQSLIYYLTNGRIRSASSLRKNVFLILAFIAGVNLELVKGYREVMDDVRELRQLCLKIIQERKKSFLVKKENNLLNALLETQNAQNPEERFTDENIVDEFVTFFTTGMDTTGHLVTMAIYLLHKNPKSFEKLQEEINRVYNKTELVTIEDLNQMDYMQCVLKETMRLYTPAPSLLPRLVETDHTLGDLKIKKGSVVRPTPFYNFVNPKYFEGPRDFKPERWLNKKEQELEAFAFIPFSAGARNCIGQHLALIEAKIILSEFIKTFRSKLSDQDFQLAMTFNFVYSPKNKIEMDLSLKT